MIEFARWRWDVARNQGRRLLDTATAAAARIHTQLQNI
jgi:hypothetical protein